MANPQHVEWLKEGAEKWNARREAARLHAEGLPYEHTGVTQPDETLLTPNLQDANLSGAKLREADLRGADLREAKLNRAKLNWAKLFEADLNGAELNGANLQEANLSRAKLNRAKLNRAELNGANLQEANLSRANLNGAKLNRAKLNGAELNGAILQEANLSGADLREANLSEANLSRANLIEANLSRAELNGAILQEAELNGANLSRAKLNRAKLNRAELNGANLQEANLSRANLNGAKLNRAKLFGAELNGANLQEANLSEADLIGAKLRGAKLNGANLQEANLSRANLQEAELNRADLQEANLSRAKLNRAKLFEAELNGANLQEANLSRANLNWAKLFEADLNGAELNGAILQEANLSEADLIGAKLRSVKRQRSANDGSRWHFTNLTHSRGLTQDRLNEAIGDTGVILPEGLVHPDHWPELEDEGVKEPEVVEEVIESRPAFVFLSYSHEDRVSVDQVHPLLLEQDMPIWWDVDILPGQNWATEIKHHLDDAAAVLVLWTENSVESTSVVEEARQAQSRGALVHARMDDADLPYGFSETQYADLRGWDGTADHPEMKKLLQALRDKLSPPGSKEIEERLVSNSSIGTQIEDGKISFADTPVGVEPPVHNPDELAARIEGQKRTADDLIEQRQKFDYNTVPREFEFYFERYRKKLLDDPLNWFNLDDSMVVIKSELAEQNYKKNWDSGFVILCDQLLAGHDKLEPLLRPKQSPENSPERKPEGPDPVVSRTKDIPIDAGAGEFETIAGSDDTSEVLDEPSRDVLLEQSLELKENLDEYKNPTDTRDNKGGRLRRSIKKVAATLAVTIGAIASGIATSVLTAPEAAKTLMANLQTFLDLLLKLF